MEKLIPFAIFGAIALIAVLIVALAFYYEKRRTDALRRVADELALPFFLNGDPTLIDRLASLHLFSQGDSKVIKNMLHGETDDVALGIFDFQYSTGSGKSRNTVKQTVVSIDAATLGLPDFIVRPEHFFHKIGKVFGMKDINFDSHPRFSKMFLLQGSDEATIRAALREEILAWFEGKPEISAEGNGTHLIVYRAGKRTAPQEVRRLMEEAFSLFGLLKGGKGLGIRG